MYKQNYHATNESRDFEFMETKEIRLLLVYVNDRNKEGS